MRVPVRSTAPRIPASEQRRRSACVRLVASSSFGPGAMRIGSRSGAIHGSFPLSMPPVVFSCRDLRPFIAAQADAAAARTKPISSNQGEK